MNYKTAINELQNKITLVDGEPKLIVNNVNMSLVYQESFDKAHGKGAFIDQILYPVIVEYQVNRFHKKVNKYL